MRIDGAKALMTHRLPRLLLAGAFIAMMAAPAAAANKEHQQLMADIRMLQEQAQILQTLLGTLTETVKAVNTRLDQQTEVNRKAFADQKLVIDNLANEARIIREKLDDNNVRVGTLTQEVDALRSAMQQSTSRPTSTEPPTDPGAAAAGAPPAASAPVMGASPKQTFEAAQADYFAGQYDLAISGFDSYIKSYPKSPTAANAQVYICNAYINDGKYQQAVAACDTAIRSYPGSDALADAYYHKGMALAQLKDTAGARTAYEFVIKTYPATNFADLAKQGLEKLKR
jgi:tol-pal system protein YbgF